VVFPSLFGKGKNMKLVPVSDIPTELEEIPLDNPLEVFRVCCEMAKHCDDWHGLGLSAVQVGIPWKLFIIKDNGDFRYFVNCEYEAVGEDNRPTIEGCLSLPGRMFICERHAVVRVYGQELIVDKNEPKFVSIDETMKSDVIGGGGTVFQHEIDHHRGVLISDHGKEYFGQFG